MSAGGHCADNASAEEFFGLIKRERIYRQRYLSLNDTQADAFDYIERFHNPCMQRRVDHPDRIVTTATQPSVETQ